MFEKQPGREEKPQVKENLPSLETLEEKLAFAQKYFLTDFLNPSTPEFVKPIEVEESATFVWDATLVRSERLTNEIAVAIKGALGVDLMTNPTHRTTGEMQYDAWLIAGATSPAYVLKRETGGEAEVLALHEELIEMFPEMGKLRKIDE